MKAEAQWEDLVFDHHVGALNHSIQEQEAHVALFNIVPVFGNGVHFSSVVRYGLAIINASDAAEAWRKSFVNMLNETFAKESGVGGWNYKAGPEVWSKAPPFNYKGLGAYEALQSVLKPLAVLALWTLGALLFAYVAMRRMKVV